MAFDPYHKWLAILPKDQPPNHYRLLSVELYESDLDVIEGAADRAMGFIRQYQSGEYAALAAKLLNEIATARLCLLKPKSKAEYDAKLKQNLLASQVPKRSNTEDSYSIEVPPVELQGSPTIARPAPRKKRSAARRKTQSNSQLLVGGGIAAVVILSVGIMLMNRSEPPLPKPATGDSTIADHKPALPEKAVSTEPVKTAESVTTPQSDKTLEHVNTPLPVKTTQPIKTLEPAETLEPVRTPETVTTLEPEKTPEPTRSAETVDSNITTNLITSKTTGMKLAMIPKGVFQMGNSEADVRAYLKADSRSREKRELARFSVEQPQHTVQISQFYMGIYEVTQGEYEQVMGTNPSYFSKSGAGREMVSGLDTNRFPVEQVSLFDAIEFCNRLSTMDGLSTYYSQQTNVQREGGSIKNATVSIAGGNGYRLPTEAQWECACRATTTSAFHFGNVLNGDKANVNGNFPFGTTKKGKYLGRPTTVGSYPENKFGLCDMHANVWEWCFDSFDDKAYSKRSGTTVDPVVTGTWVHVVRGNSWEDHARHTRSAYRGENPADYRGKVGGFRVAR